jgi:hypothetical protein
MAERADDDVNLQKSSDERLRDAGGKGSWERTVESVPSSGGDDPKDHERNKGDLSVREGDLGPEERRPT